MGQVGNVAHEKVSLGKAGRARWLGRRPHTRGMVMNPVDHPMGGGQGKSKGVEVVNILSLHGVSWLRA